LSIENQSNLTLDIVSAELDKLLDAKSKEINDLINLNKPINSVDT
jgi:hypothetical protein